MPEEKSNVICPECDAENPKETETCHRCGLDLPGFFQFNRLMNARDKTKEREAKEQKDKEEKERKEKESKQPKKRTPGWLGRR